MAKTEGHILTFDKTNFFVKHILETINFSVI